MPFGAPQIVSSLINYFFLDTSFRYLVLHLPITTKPKTKTKTKTIYFSCSTRDSQPFTPKFPREAGVKILKITLYMKKGKPKQHNSISMFSQTSLATCNEPSLINFKLRLLKRSREYCLDAFLQSVPAFIITANSS